MSNYFCTNSGRDCSCNCPPPCPSQQPCQQESAAPQQSGCPCSEDFRRALDLLCCPRLRPLVDFNTFAFVTNFYILGAALTTPVTGTAPGDNLDDPAGSYVCGGDSCEALTVSGVLYPPEAGAAALASTVTQVALCRLNAIAFGAAAADDSAETGFQTLSQTLGQLLRPKKPKDCDNLADALTNAAAVRASTVTTGPLIVENSTILGQLGDILVMANSTDSRFYFICTEKIDFLG